MRESFLDTVFNVDLVEDILGEELWNTINPMFEYDLLLESKAYTALFNTPPAFVESLEDPWEHPPFFVGLLMVMTRNFPRLGGGQGDDCGVRHVAGELASGSQRARQARTFNHRYG